MDGNTEIALQPRSITPQSVASNASYESDMRSISLGRSYRRARLKIC